MTSQTSSIEKSTKKRKTCSGVVLSDKMQKTIVVKIDRKVQHPLYKKYRTLTKKLKAHDEEGLAKVGDFVEIFETRPLSKDKHWCLGRVVRKSSI